MFKKTNFSSQSWTLPLFLFSLSIMFILFQSGFAQTPTHLSEAVLQGTILIHPEKVANPSHSIAILPGSPVKLSALIKNSGNAPSPIGIISIRFALTPPLQNQSGSSFFETEKQSLPSIKPGDCIEIVFSTPHTWPSLIDFIRYDWGMREYQAIIEVDRNQATIGTLAITYSATYYPTVSNEIATPLPSSPRNGSFVHNPL